MQIVMYQPDIPQNLGAVMRLAACLGLRLHIVEPCGFPFDDKRIKRAGMDYIEQVEWTRHNNWERFEQFRREQHARLVVMTTKAAVPYMEHRFAPDDMVLFGRESAGIPESVHDCADVRLIIPMQPEARSLNVAMSAAMVAGEAIRQMRTTS